MNIQDYAKHFNNTFKTNISENLDLPNLPMLQWSFKYLGEYFYKPNDESRTNTDVSIQLENELIKSMTDDQKKKFDEYLENETISKSELAQQILVFGYLVAYQELKEMDALK